MRIIVVKMKLLGFALLLLVTTTTAPIVGKLAFIREIPLAATCSQRNVMQFFSETDIVIVDTVDMGKVACGKVGLFIL